MVGRRDQGGEEGSERDEVKEWEEGITTNLACAAELLL